MKRTSRFELVLATAPSLKIARKLARAALTARLVACANLLPKIESHYWWKGTLERGNEVLMVLKSSQNKLSSLEQCILANHPYDTPEFLVLRLDKGTERYLTWLRQTTR